DTTPTIRLQRAYATAEYRLADDSSEARGAVEVFRALKAHRVPFMVGGTFGLQHLTGLGRPTGNIDLYILPQDAARAEEALSLLQPDKSLALLEFRDSGMGNRYAEVGDGFKIKLVRFADEQRSPVDRAWFANARRGALFGEEISFVGPEEMIWSK